MKREKPILFSSEMVRALLDGRKTETRRVIKPQLYPIPESLGGGHGWADKGVIRDDRIDYALEPKWLRRFCHYGAHGDRLWVREMFSYREYDSCKLENMEPMVWYWADGNPPAHNWTRPKPSIHMPRALSRITLEITDIRVERVQDITEAGAVAEAFERREHFIRTWEKINAKRGYSWDSNPWVWVIGFKKIERDETREADDER